MVLNLIIKLVIVGNKGVRAVEKVNTRDSVLVASLISVFFLQFTIVIKVFYNLPFGFGACRRDRFLLFQFHG